MAGQILFFEKSKCDYTNPNASATASQGNTYASNVLDRSNRTAWVTSGSVDADNTTFDIDFTEERYIDSVIILKTNIKSYTLQYWDGVLWQDFSTVVDVTNNTAASLYHSFTEVHTSKIRLTIRGTQVADEDKYIYQFICTSRLGQLEAWPVISKPTHNQNRIVTKMLSGKVNVTEALGGFTCSLSVTHWSSDDDLTVVERLYTLGEGFLVWLCGGNENQFRTIRQGYRMEDLYLMRPVNNYSPEYVKGLYQAGLKLQIDLAESIA